ncbi:hypothetical protein ACFW2V_13685 [Streptomyces sp. NPDC058947]|uniref:hypothetical protein n=1 Tax=Streptomyces sp. NPDC058947 TaxID=3346675 RepID=UPI003681805F
MVRTAPAETDRYRYHLDEIQLGGTGLGGPTLREMLVSACIHGDDEALHDDAERAEEFAETLTRYRADAENGAWLDLTVTDARKLYDAAMSAWEYADQNNYGAEDEPDEGARRFGQHGKFMLNALTWPWEALTFADDGSHGFTKLES